MRTPNYSSQSDSIVPTPRQRSWDAGLSQKIRTWHSLHFVKDWNMLNMSHEKSRGSYPKAANPWRWKEQLVKLEYWARSTGIKVNNQTQFFRFRGMYHKAHHLTQSQRRPNRMPRRYMLKPRRKFAIGDMRMPTKRAHSSIAKEKKSWNKYRVGDEEEFLHSTPMLIALLYSLANAENTMFFMQIFNHELVLNVLKNTSKICKTIVQKPSTSVPTFQKELNLLEMGYQNLLYLSMQRTS